MNEINNLKTSLHLTDSEAHKIQTCVSRYTERNSAKYICYRVLNAVKSLYGGSDWQVAERILENHSVTIINDHYQSSKELPQLSKTLSELALKLLINKQSSDVDANPKRHFISYSYTNNRHFISYIDNRWDKLNNLPEIKDKISLKTLSRNQLENSLESVVEELILSQEQVLINQQDRLFINQQLNLWVAESTNPLEKTNREHASAEIFDFINDKKSIHINLSQLSLTSLPNIFHRGDFPKRLESLNLNGNLLTSLPPDIVQLRETLETLRLQNNEMTVLPPEICQLRALKELDLSHNELAALPPEIHQLSKLKTLNLSSNGMTVFPLEICQLSALKELDLSFNQLAALPPEIHQLSQLKRLLLVNNLLVTLPSQISQLSDLEILNAYSNRLTTLPIEIGQLPKLTYLSLTDNPTLTGLPREILNLPEKCTIELTQSGLPETVLDHLREEVNRTGYSGPNFSFAMVHANPQERGKSIEDSLKSLFGIVKRDYHEFPNLKANVDQTNLKAWLNRLSFMGDYNAKGERQQWLVNRVLDHLELAEKDVEFRETFNATINGAADTCGDRVALSVVNLGISHDLRKIDRSDMKKFADFLSRGVWAMDMLEEAARNKIPSLRFFDEVEVYLGYPVMLKDRLKLPIDIKEMLYFRCSALTEKDLNDAASMIEGKLADKAAFSSFLIKRSDWVDALKTKYSVDYKALEDKRELESNVIEDRSLEPDAYNEAMKKVEADFNNGLNKLTATAMAA